METPARSEVPTVTPQLLRELATAIADRFAPQKIVLFGSHVWGTPDAGSDVDLLVVMDSDLPAAARSARISRECRPRLLPLDVIVRTPSEVAERLGMGDPFLRRILDEGQVLYAR